MRSSDGAPAAMVDESGAGWERGGHYGLWMDGWMKFEDDAECYTYHTSDL